MILSFLLIRELLIMIQERSFDIGALSYIPHHSCSGTDKSLSVVFALAGKGAWTQRHRNKIKSVLASAI